MLHGTRILLVEDEALIAITAEDALLEAGASVSLAMALPLALTLARGGAFHAAILDVNLGHSTSFPAAELLAARRIPFLFATGYGAAGLASEFAGRPVVQKPYDPYDLIKAVAKLIYPD